MKTAHSKINTPPEYSNKTRRIINGNPYVAILILGFLASYVNTGKFPSINGVWNYVPAAIVLITAILVFSLDYANFQPSRRLQKLISQSHIFLVLLSVSLLVCLGVIEFISLPPAYPTPPPSFAADGSGTKQFRIFRGPNGYAYLDYANFQEHLYLDQLRDKGYVPEKGIHALTFNEIRPNAIVIEMSLNREEYFDPNVSSNGVNYGSVMLTRCTKAYRKGSFEAAKQATCRDLTQDYEHIIPIL